MQSSPAASAAIWVPIGLTILFQIIFAVAFIVSIRHRADTLAQQLVLDRASDSERHREIQDSIKGLAQVVSALSTTAAVSGEQHRELSRRVDDIINKMGRHDEHIARLRTVAHMHGNKLHEIDPTWKPYRRTEDDVPEV